MTHRRASGFRSVPAFSRQNSLSALARDKQVDLKVVKQAFKDLEIDPEKADPTTV